MCCSPVQLAMSSRSASSSGIFSVRQGSATLLLSLFLLVPLYAQEPAEEPFTKKVCAIFNECRDSVVRIEAVDMRGKVNGTGFFADPSGTIYTLAAVVGTADEILVVQGDKKMPAKLLLSDPRSGVALLKVDETSPFIPAGNSHQLPLSSLVMAIGYPMNHDVASSVGVVSGFDRQFLGRYFMTTHIRANLPAQRGFGGAPLVNMKGQVVGILIAAIDGGAPCYVLPIEAAEKIRMNYARFGEARHGWVGVHVEDIETPQDGSRARIANLEPNTPAAKSGLQNGDMLLQIGDVKVSSVEDVIDGSFFLTAGNETTVTVMRDGKKIDISVRATKHPVTEAPQELHALGPEATQSINITSGD